MAIYRLAQSSVSRGQGRSAIASAAYVSGSRLIDTAGVEPSAVGAAAHNAGEVLEFKGRAIDYSTKPVAWSGIVTPEGSPEWGSDRQTLWSRVEAGERRKDAQLCKSVIVTLPRELTIEQNVELLRGFAEEHLVAGQGLVVDAAIHQPLASDGEKQPHGHLLYPTRQLSPDGTWGRKLPHLDRKPFLRETRQAWEQHVNRALERAGRPERVSCKSLKDRGIDLEPTIPLGPAGSRRAGRGLTSERVDHNRAVAVRNGAKLLADPSIAVTMAAQSGERVEVVARRHSAPHQLGRVLKRVQDFARAQAERVRAAVQTVATGALRAGLGNEKARDRQVAHGPLDPINLKSTVEQDQPANWRVESAGLVRALAARMRDRVVERITGQPTGTRAIRRRLDQEERDGTADRKREAAAASVAEVRARMGAHRDASMAPEHVAAATAAAVEKVRQDQERVKAVVARMRAERDQGRGR